MKEAKDFCLQNIQICSEPNPVSCSVGTGIISREQSGRGLNVTIHLHIVPALRMNGAKPLFPSYVVMGWTGKILP
jgi:hypothetical protein